MLPVTLSSHCSVYDVTNILGQEWWLRNEHMHLFQNHLRDCAGVPVAETPHSSAGGVGSIPDQGAKTPHASWPKKQNLNSRSKIVTNSIKTFKKWSTSKKALRKESLQIYRKVVKIKQRIPVTQLFPLLTYYIHMGHA